MHAHCPPRPRPHWPPRPRPSTHHRLSTASSPPASACRPPQLAGWWPAPLGRWRQGRRALQARGSTRRRGGGRRWASWGRAAPGAMWVCQRCSRTIPARLRVGPRDGTGWPQAALKPCRPRHLTRLQERARPGLSYAGGDQQHNQQAAAHGAGRLCSWRFGEGAHRMCVSSFACCRCTKSEQRCSSARGLAGIQAASPRRTAGAPRHSRREIGCCCMIICAAAALHDHLRCRCAAVVLLQTVQANQLGCQGGVGPTCTGRRPPAAHGGEGSETLVSRPDSTGHRGSARRRGARSNCGQGRVGRGQANACARARALRRLGKGAGRCAPETGAAPAGRSGNETKKRHNEAQGRGTLRG